MKSGLYNIGEKELSETAYNLEQLGKMNEPGLILTETPSFIAALTALARKLKPNEAAEEEDIPVDISDHDMAFLRDKLDEIKTACERIRKKAAMAALDKLRMKAWPREVKNLLDDLSDNLLLGEFKKAAASAGKYLTSGD
jgi:HPt (histidine-containing phosphotransfer) domain-containing protein